MPRRVPCVMVRWLFSSIRNTSAPEADGVACERFLLLDEELFSLEEEEELFSLEEEEELFSLEEEEELFSLEEEEELFSLEEEEEELSLPFLLSLLSLLFLLRLLLLALLVAPCLSFMMTVERCACEFSGAYLCVKVVLSSVWVCVWVWVGVGGLSKCLACCLGTGVRRG
jgi:hypothetical protein